MGWDQKPKRFKIKETTFEGDFEPYIGAWTIDPAVCDRMIEAYEAVADKSVFDENRGYHRLTNKLIDVDVHKEYMKWVHDCFSRYKKRYKWCDLQHTRPWFVAQPYNIQKYEPDFSYKKWHIEDPGPREGKLQRHLTFMTYLNDIEEGGETEFLCQDLDVQPKKGLTLIWPAGWTHPHRGRPAPNETKYIATGWAVFEHRC